MGQLIAALREFTEKVIFAKDWLDLQAQQDMAFWAKWMFWATVASLIVSAIALVGAWLSLRYTRIAVRDTRQLGEVETQAYVHASGLEFGKYDNILVTCKNSGQTPSLRFSVNAIAQIVQKGSVENSLKFTDDNYKTWSVLGAGEEQPVSVIEGSEVIKQFKAKLIDDKTVLVVSGQIKYFTIYEHEFLTQFAFFAPKSAAPSFLKPTSKLNTFQRVQVAPPVVSQKRQRLLALIGIVVIAGLVVWVVCR